MLLLQVLVKQEHYSRADRKMAPTYHSCLGDLFTMFNGEFKLLSLRDGACISPCTSENSGFQRSVWEGRYGKEDEHVHSLLVRRRSFRNSPCGALGHLALNVEQMEHWLLCISKVLQVIVSRKCEGSVW